MSTDNKFTNRAEYNMNFEIGSTHWINTLMSSVNHIGEFMLNNPNTKRYLLEEWGKQLKNVAQDIIEWRESNSVPALHIDDCIKKLNEAADNLKEFKEMSIQK